MIYLLLSLLALGLLTAIGTLLAHKKDEPEAPLVVHDSCDTCSDGNDLCEQECMMLAATQPVEYFDDEELDQFKGRASDDFSDDEAEVFAEVMQTMRPDEVKAWNRSLILRGINMPNQIKDDYIALAHD